MADNKGIKSLWGYPLIDSKGRHAIDDVRSNLENNFQKKTDDTLTTTSKSIVGSINEVNAQYKDIANNKADKTDLQAQKTRIDNLTTLPQGSTTGDAELIDGRVGADGVIYNNIGGAIRGQFSDIVQKDTDNLLRLLDKEETTINGLTYSVKNNVISINGTATSYTAFDIPFVLHLDLTKTYYFMVKRIEGTNNDGKAKLLRFGNDNKINASLPTNSNSYTRAITQPEAAINKVSIAIAEASVLNNYKINAWVSEHETEYEAPNTMKLADNIHINEINMPTDYTTLKTTINNIDTVIRDKYETVIPSSNKPNTYLSDQLTENEYTGCSMGTIDVKKGEEFTLSTTSIGVIRPWLLVNNDTLVDSLPQDFSMTAVTYKDIKIIIKQDGKLYIHGYLNAPILTKKSGVELPQLGVNAENIQLLKAGYESFAIQEQLKNDFSWKTPTKLYVTFSFDDSNADIGDIQDLFARKNVPCCFATIPNKLNSVCNNGKTVKQVLHECENNNGEVLAHWQTPLTQNSTNEDYENVYIGAKKILANEGYNVQGIITAGGENYNTQNFSKCVKVARPYYRYGDLTSYNNNNIEQYYNMRYFLATDNNDNKAKIDKFITNGQLFYNDSPSVPYGKPHWLPLASHGANDKITISMLEELIDYILAKGTDTIEIINYRDLFDLATSSKLEKRLLSLEN